MYILILFCFLLAHFNSFLINISFSSYEYMPKRNSEVCPTFTCVIFGFRICLEWPWYTPCWHIMQNLWVRRQVKWVTLVPYMVSCSSSVALWWWVTPNILPPLSRMSFTFTAAWHCSGACLLPVFSKIVHQFFPFLFFFSYFLLYTIKIN